MCIRDRIYCHLYIVSFLHIHLSSLKWRHVDCGCRLYWIYAATGRWTVVVTWLLSRSSVPCFSFNSVHTTLLSAHVHTRTVSSRNLFLLSLFSVFLCYISDRQQHVIVVMVVVAIVIIMWCGFWFTVYNSRKYNLSRVFIHSFTHCSTKSHTILIKICV